ncbi:MAG: membrane protein insertion efficiency factor YidD [Gammaproteobacteria bacterium]
MKRLTTEFKKVLISFIQYYRRRISPRLPPACRYQPTCSKYALEAIEKFGPGRGLWLTVKRLAKCHPWGGQGYDPVPPKNGLSDHMDKRN